jgi:hypothetical protein
MSLPQKKLNVPSPAADRRRARRVRVDLAGSYLLANGREHCCQVQDISLDAVALVAPVAGRMGERVIAYLDEIGRIEGMIVRLHSIGFVMTITATPRKRDKLAAQLTWLANRHALDLKQQRSHDRLVPRDPRATMVMPDGIGVPCRIVEMSATGAAVASETRPPIDALIHLGKVEGRVVRVSGDGFAVQFTSPQDPELLEASLTNPA